MCRKLKIPTKAKRGNFITANQSYVRKGLRKPKLRKIR